MYVSAMHKINHEMHGQDANEARGEAKCFILRVVRARPCFNYFKELTHESLVKAYPFQLLPLCQLHHLK